MSDNDAIDVTSPHEGSPGLVDSSSQLPQRIGRYRVEKLLGKGGFGLVYLAHDEQLSRRVAIKVPHAHLVSNAVEAAEYQIEARTVANLDHPAIVPVYDVGSSDTFPCYIVSKFVEGTSLTDQINDARQSCFEAATLVATVAEALHYAHKQGLVHRDVKPSNILIDKAGKPFLVDFGLALREEEIGKGPRSPGTPSYMSPEQARGEGHRVDGRSDIFSLGVVFYELLVGRRPFRGGLTADLFDQITNHEPKPPRQYDDLVPRELERICLKMLSKRATDRYLTANDLAEDLRAWSREARVVEVDKQLTPNTAALDTVDPTPTATPTPASQPIKIVPKGLRSFDEHDADFFLELLPGPRDREGLPDSIRFWKTRIEETDPDKTFSVGLIYGPSGCGKSSLIKAGLLPRLAENVISVYVEATAHDTEKRLLHGLHRHCPALNKSPSLKDTLASLRRGQDDLVGKKVLIVLDQFEQWLHSKTESENTDLVQALRQCDGEHVQCIVMVRDDFWMGVSRFMRDLEIRLLEGHNSALVDLFDTDHARKVLTAFGRAFCKLPEHDLAKDQKEFLKQTVTGLAEDGKVFCVRLALFAEMMKGKPWMSATLKEVGGTQGIGTTFLEETFSVSAAPPERRYHQKAARAILKALLPESGSDIKGNMKSCGELLDESGYFAQSKDFDDLIRILDSELRLITPTDPDGSDADGGVAPQTAGHKYFQLTHDYLVPSLREWLTRKKKETRRGRAELRLDERAALWTAKPENRHLPTLLEYLNIRLLTNRQHRTESQQRMMRKAGRFYGLRTSVALSILIGVTLGAVELFGRYRAAFLVEQLASADISQVPGIIETLGNYRRWADPLLREKEAEAEVGSPKKLHLMLALLPIDRSKIQPLEVQLCFVTPVQFPVVRDALLPHKDVIVEPLWATVFDFNGFATNKMQERFQAACALATYAPEDGRWKTIRKFVARTLVNCDATILPLWREALRPAKAQLLPSLTQAYEHTLGPFGSPPPDDLAQPEDDYEVRVAQVRSLKDVLSSAQGMVGGPPTPEQQSQIVAGDTLGNYFADCPEVLFGLLTVADRFQFPVLFDKLAAHRPEATALCRRELQKQATEAGSEDEKDALAKRQANAAIALYRMRDYEAVWPQLKSRPDPRVRSYMIHWFDASKCDPQPFIQRLDIEANVTIRQALILTLGSCEYRLPEYRMPVDQAYPLIEKLFTLFENEPDAGLHGAVECVLRQWGGGVLVDRVQTTIDRLRSNEEQVQTRRASDTKQRWYVNTQGQTFAIVDPGEFAMGSPASETGREADEGQYRQRISRRFAISTTEVTNAQYRRFQKEHPDAGTEVSHWVKTDDSPQAGMTWYEAAWYCNWLSEQEGIDKDEWCYEPNETGTYGPGMKAKDKFWELRGYRLPTEAEWEYACRAGTGTSRYYGSDESLLTSHARHQANGGNRTWPVARLKPNDFGLFDMLGNVWEWCYDRKIEYPNRIESSVDDTPDTTPVHATDKRVLRGGAFVTLPANVRSACRNGYRADDRDSPFGFRPARTLP